MPESMDYLRFHSLKVHEQNIFVVGTGYRNYKNEWDFYKNSVLSVLASMVRIRIVSELF